MYAYRDNSGYGYIADGFDFTYWFATKAEVERFAQTMHLPISWC